LAAFSSTLFGESVRTEDIIKESYVERKYPYGSWLPSVPGISDEDLYNLDVDDDGAVITLTERLTGKICSTVGSIAERVSSMLSGNHIVQAIEGIFEEPKSIQEAAFILRGSLPERADVPPDVVRREIEAYLLVGSIGDEDHPPRLRPKLHAFFHGIYDVSLCTNPDCRSLVPQGGAICGSCGSVARPAALCRTCGQDFIKVRFQREGDDLPVGTADYYSDDNTAFLTHEIWELPDAAELEHEIGEEGKNEKADTRNKGRRAKGKEEADSKLERVGFCLNCGRILEETAHCPSCNRPSILMFQHRGKLSTCPACGDTYPRGDIVTPLRTGTASSVSVLITHHLDALQGKDRKLLVFADNRQDAAHQAGYTADKHRSFALRHSIAREVLSAGERGVYLEELPQRLFDVYRDLSIIPRRPTQPEKENWLLALKYEAANEFTRYSRQRAALETLGIVAVDYEFLNELTENEMFRAIVKKLEMDAAAGVNIVRAQESGRCLRFFPGIYRPKQEAPLSRA
jgi:hypothetical protein